VKDGARGVKLLFVMETPEYLRYFDSTFALLLEQGHALALAVNEDKQKKQVRLERFGGGHPSLEILGVAPEHDGVWGEIAKGLRGTVDYVRFLHPDYRNAPALRNRMTRKVLPVAFTPLSWISTLPAPVVQGMLAFLSRCERAIPPSREILAFIDRIRPDAVFVSPLVDAASAQVDFIKAARHVGVPAGVCVASWDNLTNKGLLRIEPDLVTVWNETQRDEAAKYHAVPRQRVTATGAQLFDRWFKRRPSTDRETFCRTVGLPTDRPFFVFTGSSGFISEAGAEVAFTKRWLQAVRSSDNPAVANVGILVRPHPYNFKAWAEEDLQGVSATTVWPRGPYNPIAEESRAVYYDTLYHAAGVFGINTSAMVEAAILGRPVFSLRAKEFSTTQEGTLHFHYLLVENGGCVQLAGSMAEHLSQLAGALEQPDRYTSQTRAFVERFLRPHGIDKPAVPIFAETLVGLARRGRQPKWRAASWWAVPVRGLVLGVSLVTGTIARLSDRRWRARARKDVSRWFERTYKRGRRLLSRKRK
jgi:hypothetical protein